MSAPSNVLLVLSDEHRPDALSCAGHDAVSTPTLDELAESGTRFTNAYCPSPLCAPCRASFSTGRYVHEIGAWDNAASYAGSPPSWGDHFAEQGVDTTTVGKLDFQPGVQGFPKQVVPWFRENPDINGLYRSPPNVREDGRDRIMRAGPTDGPNWHEERDETRLDRALTWLDDHSEDEGWILSANFSLPHFPLTAEQSWYDEYADLEEMPMDYPAADDHPILEELRDHFDGRDLPEDVLHRTRRAYYALCARLDDQIDRLLQALEDTGQREDTLVIYTSDHGEPLGDHECWWKCCMYESSVGIPMIVDGPGVADQTVEAPVSMLDIVPTIADAMALDADSSWRGHSQWPVLSGDREPDSTRAVFSEYHAHGTSHGMFMLRQGRYKYIHYPHRPDQLFDVDTDPDEMNNLAEDPAYEPVRERLWNRLTERVDPSPDAIDRAAHADQRRRRSQPEAEWWGASAQ